MSMNPNPRRPRSRGLLLALLAASVVAGCGGSGGDAAAPAPAPAPPPATTPVAVTVIDGAIRNALVCLDANSNGACDTGEVSGRTDAAGNVTLQVPAADAGRYPVVAVVGTDAVDADHGPVTVPFVMKAPADQPAVVSPLTTLVQGTVESTGVSTSAAVATVQNALGLSVSPLQNYTASTSTENVTLGTVARLVVVTQQQQSTALGSTVGSRALDGSTITRADIDRLVTRRLLEILPDLAEKLADPAVQTAIATGNPGTINTALQPLAQQIVASPSTGLTTTSVATLVAVDKQAGSGTADTSINPSAQLTALTFNSPQSWFRRVLTVSQAQTARDANGRHQYGDNRSRASSGVVANWSFGQDPDRQSDLHWNGSAWVACALGQGGRSTLRDAQGRSTYDYCDNFETGTSRRASFDIGGRSMLEVYNELRGAGMTNITIEGASTVLGTATFPTGAGVAYQTNTALTTAPTYIPRVRDIVRVYSNPLLTAGDQTECNKITSTTPQGTYTTEAQSLEAMVTALSGTVCSYQTDTRTGAGGATITSGARNEAWGFSSLSVGQLGTATTVTSAAQASTFFTTNQLLRVAFGANNATRYFSCRQRFDGSVRNCDLIGTGTYSISTLGDARVLMLNNQPVQFAALGYERLFVERAGKVHFGYKNRLAPVNSARFNTTASNALLTQLGLATVQPSDTVTLTPASYQGDWLVWPGALGANGYLSDQAALIRIGSNFNGTTGYTCLDTNTGMATTSFTCTLQINPASGAVTFSDAETTGALAFDFVSGTVTGTFTPMGGTPQAATGRRR